MKSSVNYEEDLFLLKGLIKYWNDALNIPADPEMFSGKLMDDLDFIDSFFKKILASLQNSPNLIHRGELLHNFAGAESAFIACLESILAGASPLAQEMTSLHGPILAIKATHQDQLVEVRKTLRRLVHGEPMDEEEDLITPMEMEILFRKEED